MMSRILKAYNADIVVAPSSLEEVQGVVRIANKYKVPVYPFGRGASMTNAAAPRAGGIMLPMIRMNKIIEINERTRTATFEAGVSWSQLVFEANRKGLEPRTLPGGPHSGTPIGNYSIGGGPLGVFDVNEVVTLEAVLGNGDIIRTGSAAYMTHEKQNPYNRIAYGPNITGLFRSAMGIFGIITSVTFRLYPVRKIEGKHQD